MRTVGCRSWLLALALLLLLAWPALAGGTHFLVEPATGITFNHGFDLEDAVGLEAGGVLGVGGKFKGFPPRFRRVHPRAAHGMIPRVPDRSALRLLSGHVQRGAGNR